MEPVSGEESLHDTAEVVLGDVLSQPPTLSEGRLLCLDGPAGSGKTTLARAVLAVARPLVETTVLHLDDLYDGWGGLPVLGEQLRGLLSPLTRGEATSYRRYDWHTGCYAETHLVAPSALLVLDGVGAGARSCVEQTTTLVWVDAPRELRLRRGLERDGAAMRGHWRAWMRDEAALFATERTRDRAHLLVDGTGHHPTVSRR